MVILVKKPPSEGGAFHVLQLRVRVSGAEAVALVLGEFVAAEVEIRQARNTRKIRRKIR